MSRPKFEIPHRKLLIGLVGGIGSGKSEVAQTLSQHGGHLIVADRIGHEALEVPAIQAAIFRRWGDRVRGEQGEVDRKKLGAIVFASPVERTNLEYLVFPHIEQRVREEIARAENDPNCRFTVLDAAIMLEVGWNSLCDRIVYVDAPREVRLARLGPTRGWTEEELDRRELAQMALTEKKKCAHHVLDNGGTKELLHTQIGKLIREWNLSQS